MCYMLNKFPLRFYVVKTILLNLDKIIKRFEYWKLLVNYTNKLSSHHTLKKKLTLHFKSLYYNAYDLILNAV